MRVLLSAYNSDDQIHVQHIFPVRDDDLAATLA